MNRTIKFRAWLKKEKRMVDVETVCFCSGEIFAIQTVNEIFFVEEIELMQATGLKDKGGKEIFEGDIVKLYDLHDKNLDLIAEVFYEEFQTSFVLCVINVLGDELCRENTSDYKYEVISSIYENPELLEVRDYEMTKIKKEGGNE